MFRWSLLLCVLILTMAETRHSKKKKNQNRVFDGVPLNHKKHKYLVIIVNPKRGQCSGSIIAKNWILTAAHCFTKFYTHFNIYHHRSEDVARKLIAEVINENVEIHPEYDSKIPTRYADMALMKTTDRIRFDDFVNFIKLSRKGVHLHQRAIIAGYGRANPDGRPAGREGNLVVKECPKGFTNVICTSSNVRAASGDSGGALVRNRHLVGVTSASCTDAENVHLQKDCLSIFANVTANLEWIKSTMKENDHHQQLGSTEFTTEANGEGCLDEEDDTNSSEENSDSEEDEDDEKHTTEHGIKESEEHTEKNIEDQKKSLESSLSRLRAKTRLRDGALRRDSPVHFSGETLLPYVKDSSSQHRALESFCQSMREQLIAKDTCRVTPVIITIGKMNSCSFLIRCPSSGKVELTEIKPIAEIMFV